MNNIWSVSIDDYITIMEEAIVLGKQRGKKPGDNLEQEFFEIAKKKNKLPKYIGQTEMDKDLLLGNMREEGLKVTSLEELQKRNETKSQ